MGKRQWLAGAQGLALLQGSHKHMGRQTDKVTMVHRLFPRSCSEEEKTERLPRGGVFELGGWVGGSWKEARSELGEAGPSIGCSPHAEPGAGTEDTV